jgi:hypothetical protein
VEEKLIENDIGEILEILDRNWNQWSSTGSKVTTTSLIHARNVASKLLGAVHSETNRLENTVAAIYQTTLVDLIRCIRAPAMPKRAGVADQGVEWRKKAEEDRHRLKALFRSVVTKLRDMTLTSNDTTFQAVMKAPKEVITKWCADQLIEIEGIDVTQNLENADGLELIVDVSHSIA